MKKSMIYRSVNKKVILFFISIILGISFFIFDKTEVVSKEYEEPIFPHTLVSHAGGTIYGFRYTNSLEALEESYKNGFKLIEVDFEWTSDNNPVLIHDWENTTERLFMIKSRTLSLNEFKDLDTFQNVTLMDLEDIANWLITKKDVFIITDVKNNNLELLNLLSETHEDIQGQIIPQVYSFEEYLPVKEMGYDNIILTLYKSVYSDDEILEFVKVNQVFGITMPIERGYTDLPMLLREQGVTTYAHTVNDFFVFEKLHENGVTGIYTDYFHANKFEY